MPCISDLAGLTVCSIRATVGPLSLFLDMTKAQAEKLARQIFDRFGDQIRQAVKGTNIPARFIAGLVANEAGKDKQGNIKREATRFEPHVYARLKQVSQNPRSRYGSITHSQLKDATDGALRALATSWEATQMMGYHVLTLGCSLADLRNPDKHFFYTVKLLQLNGFPKNATEEQMDREMRQWNTGRETGKTYHANYVPNARLIRAAYDELEKRYKPSSSAAASTAEGKADHPAGAAAGNPPQSGPANTLDPPPTVTEQTTVETPKGTSVATTTTESGTVEMTAPPKDGATAASTKMVIAGVTVPPIIAGVLKAISDAVSQGYVSAAEIGSFLMQFLRDNIKWVLVLFGLVIILLIVKKIVKQVTFWLQMLTHAIPGWNSIEVQPVPVEPKKGWLRRAWEWVW